jgi:hypothetical protein
MPRWKKLAPEDGTKAYQGRGLLPWALNKNLRICGLLHCLW